jgi:argininosuccinate synthase
MTNRVVLAFFGDSESTAAIARLAAQGDVAVVAVALELGRGPALAGLKDAALAAGATRCHAFDLREQFARDVLIRALRDGARADLAMRTMALAEMFVARKLREVADIEQGEVVHTAIPPALVAGSPVRTLSAERASLELRFDNGEPVALNDVPMSLSELTECLETISGLAAADVLCVAYSALGSSGTDEVMLVAEGRTCRAAVAAGA